jgi:hypothetical protein
MGNRHAFNDFLRTRVKPSIVKEPEKEEDVSSAPVFKRPPPKKPILTTEDDDDEDNQFISIRASVSVNTTENDNDNDETNEYKLKSSRQKPRGVFSTNEKKPMKSLMEISEQKDADDDNKEEEDDDDDVDNELFEP